MRDTIETARKALGISADDCCLVPPHRHVEITQKMAHQFTTLYREPLKTIWWWEHLKKPCRSLYVPDPLSIVAGLLEANESYWFLAEAWERQKQESAFWLYEMSGRVIPLILRETHHFEYYIVDRKMTWLLCENHHRVLAAVGEPMLRRLPKHENEKHNAA